jgi:hypothetical protein
LSGRLTIGGSRGMIAADPVPTWHAEVYCGAPFAHDGFAATLASAPGASAIVIFPGAPADASRLMVVV